MRACHEHSRWLCIIKVCVQVLWQVWLHRWGATTVLDRRDECGFYGGTVSQVCKGVSRHPIPLVIRPAMQLSSRLSGSTKHSTRLGQPGDL